MTIFTKNKILPRVQFRKEKKLENEVFENSNLFFGEKAILLPKKKLEGIWKSTITDGFLFDFSESHEPILYMVEIEMEDHSFYNHILEQITKFFGVLVEIEFRIDLAKKLEQIINNDANLRRKFIDYSGDMETFKFLVNLIEENIKVLLIMDSEKHIDKINSMKKIYFEQWGKMIRTIVLKKFSDGKETVYYMHPDWKILDVCKSEISVHDKKKKRYKYDESHHIKELGNSILEIYQDLKSEIKNLSSKIYFNYRKRSISVNIGDGREDERVVYIFFGVKTINLIFFVSYDEAIKDLSTKENFKLRNPSENVIKWHGADVCNITLRDKKNMGEVVGILKKIVNKTPS